MNDPEQPDLYAQTLPQQGPSPSIPGPNETAPLPAVSPSTSPPTSGTIAMPVRPVIEFGESTSTMAAPAGYNPAFASTRAGSIAYQPQIFEAKEALVGGRFEVLRAHARGGMGQVSVARDTELDREVALKEIQPRYTSDAATTARFVLEAQVTGRLEHPGIVPVYGRGNRTDGRPYYAMRFVSGQSLQDAIDEYHKIDKSAATLQQRSLALRNLLRRFVDVCNTIGYAHARGYLHRDIKPANVMLGGYGETLVVDWGLAKEMKGAGIKADTIVPVSQEPEQPGEFDQTREGFTHYGQAMGTPAFMSPEQAAGQWDVTGVGSDVYSLGAMLYAVLTGAPPYSGPTREVLTKVQRGEFTPIKLVKGDVPSPLDAVCRKAMALKIADRYSTAIDLAADVDRWLADEPVSCYVEPFHIRAQRWAKRHRTGVAAASVLLLTGTVALAVGLFAVNKEKQQTKKAYDLAAESRSEARDALLATTDDAVGEILVSSSKPTEQQKKFLENLIGMYQRFAEKDDNSPETQLFVANALARVGRLQGRINRIDQATKAFQDSLDRLAKAPANAGEDWISARGFAHLYFGILKLQHGDPGAEEQLKEARNVYQELVATNPSAENRARLSQCDDRLGVFYLTKQRWQEAGERAEAAIAVREQLTKDVPTELDYQFRLAQSLRQRANVQFMLKKTSDAIETLKKAHPVQNQLVEKVPTSAPYLALLADLETLLTDYTAGPPIIELKYGKLPDQGKETESVNYARSALRTWGRLLSLYPGEALYRRKLAEANLNLADRALNSGNGRVAIDAINASKAILDELRRDLPNDFLTEELYGSVLQARAKIFRSRGNRLAAEVVKEAVGFVEARVLLDPTNPDLRNLAVACRVEEEIVHRAEKRNDESQKSLDAAWLHVVEAAKAGSANSIKEFYRDAGERCGEFKDDAQVYPIALKIAALPLPNGRASFEAACMLGHFVESIKQQPDYTAENDFKRCVPQIGFAIQFLHKAADEGFRNVDEVKGAIELEAVREAFEFQAVIDKMQKMP